MKANRGEARTTFEELVLVETDNCVIWPFGKDRKGYGKIKIDGCMWAVHNLALFRRRGPHPPNKPEAAHQPLICHDPACMNYRHLRWADRFENVADTLIDGTRALGERHGRVRLTENEVHRMRHARLSGATLQELASEFSVSQGTVSRIVNHLLWSHI